MAQVMKSWLTCRNVFHQSVAGQFRCIAWVKPATFVPFTVPLHRLGQAGNNRPYTFPLHRLSQAGNIEQTQKSRRRFPINMMYPTRCERWYTMLIARMCPARCERWYTMLIARVYPARYERLYIMLPPAASREVPSSSSTTACKQEWHTSAQDFAQPSFRGTSARSSCSGQPCPRPHSKWSSSGSLSCRQRSRTPNVLPCGTSG